MQRKQDQQAEAFKAELNRRIASLERGDRIELADDAALQAFFKDVENRGMLRYRESRRSE